MLNSANKIKAVLVIIGDEASDKVFGNLYLQISLKDLRKYLKTKFKTMEEYQLCQLSNISKIVGLKKFLKSEFSFSSQKINEKENFTSEKSKNFNLIKYFKEEILDFEELNILKESDKFKKFDKVKQIVNIFFHDNVRLITEEEYKILLDNII